MDFNQSGEFVLIVLDSELREEYINLVYRSARIFNITSDICRYVDRILRRLFFLNFSCIKSYLRKTDKTTKKTTKLTVQ